MTINFTIEEIQEIIRLHLKNYNILHSVVRPNFNPNDMVVPMFTVSVITVEDDKMIALAKEIREKFNLETNYIDAIKYVREVTNCGMKDGKDIVDAVQDGKI